METEPSTTSTLLLRVPEACEVLSLGRSTLYLLMSSGELEVVHVGRAVRVTQRSIEAFIDRQAGRPSIRPGR